MADQSDVKTNETEATMFGGIPIRVDPMIPSNEIWLVKQGRSQTIHIHEGQQAGQTVEDHLAQLRMEDLAAPEHDRDLDLVSFVQELDDLPGLGVEVPDPDLRAVLHLLDPDARRLPSRFLGLLGRIELELPVVHDADHRRARHRCDFDQIQPLVHRRGQCGFDIHDPHLTPVSSDHPQRTDADLPVDAHSLRRVLDSSCLPLNEHPVHAPPVQTKSADPNGARACDRNPMGLRSHST